MGYVCICICEAFFFILSNMMDSFDVLEFRERKVKHGLFKLCFLDRQAQRRNGQISYGIRF